MRDRLRAASCPSEMIDQIGGWSKRSVGEGYGEGYSIFKISNVLNEAVHHSSKSTIKKTKALMSHEPHSAIGTEAVVIF